MTACREGAEILLCFCVPQYLMKEYFEKGRFSHPGRWGAFVLDFGELSQTSMDHIIQKHKENLVKIKSLDRPPTNCESEMLELRWCSYKNFTKSVEECVDKNNLVIKDFDEGKFSPWCLKYYKMLVKNFKE